MKTVQRNDKKYHPLAAVAEHTARPSSTVHNTLDELKTETILDEDGTRLIPVEAMEALVLALAKKRRVLNRGAGKNGHAKAADVPLTDDGIAHWLHDLSLSFQKLGIKTLVWDGKEVKAEVYSAITVKSS